jgi:hypothetical protein
MFAVRRFANDLTTELGYDLAVESAAGCDLNQADRLLDGVCQSIALAADHDLELLADVRQMFDRDGLEHLLCFGAHCAASDSHRTDDERAAHLARLVNAEIPPSVHAFAPRHARLAAEQVDDVNRRLWLLDDFVGQACALN